MKHFIKIIPIILALLIQSCASPYIPTGKTVDLSIDDPKLYNNSLNIRASNNKYHLETFKTLYDSGNKKINNLNTKISANAVMYFIISIDVPDESRYCREQLSFKTIEGNSYRLSVDLSLVTKMCRYQLFNVTNHTAIKMDRWV